MPFKVVVACFSVLPDFVLSYANHSPIVASQLSMLSRKDLSHNVEILLKHDGCQQTYVSHEYILFEVPYTPETIDLFFFFLQKTDQTEVTQSVTQHFPAAILKTDDRRRKPERSNCKCQSFAEKVRSYSGQKTNIRM